MTAQFYEILAILIDQVKVCTPPWRLFPSLHYALLITEFWLLPEDSFQIQLGKVTILKRVREGTPLLLGASPVKCTSELDIWNQFFMRDMMIWPLVLWVTGKIHTQHQANSTQSPIEVKWRTISNRQIFTEYPSLMPCTKHWGYKADAYTEDW